MNLKLVLLCEGRVHLALACGIIRPEPDTLLSTNVRSAVCLELFDRVLIPHGCQPPSVSTSKQTEQTIQANDQDVGSGACWDLAACQTGCDD